MSRAFLAVAVFLLPTPAHAQQPSTACTLLPVAEIESALGGTASKKPAGFSMNAPGMAVDKCTVELKTPSKAVRVVEISVVKDLPMDGSEAIRTRNAGTAREAQWKAAGARLEQKNIGNAICVAHARPGVAGYSTCSIPRGKGYLEVEVRDSNQEIVPMDTVGALVQKAASR